MVDFEVFFDFLGDLVVSLGSKLIMGLIVFFVGIRIIKSVKKWLKKTNRLKNVDEGVKGFIISFTGAGLYVVLFILLAMIVGVPTASFVTVLASCGVAVGLALQGALGNLAGGIMILIFKPFHLGDYITTPDAAGTVSNITIMYTILKTPDNKVITIPNGMLTNSVVENYSAVEKRRVDLQFTTSYDCDVDLVKKVLMDVVTAHKSVCKDPEPFARLTRHGDSGLEYTVRAWCKTEDFWEVNFDLMETVKKEFDKNNITIPYPQMDIHINNND